MRKDEFKKLFDTYFDAVRSFLYYRAGDTDLSTDIAQDTFMRIWEKQMIPEAGKEKALLFKIANDLFISRYRKNATAQKHVESIKLQEKQSLTVEDEYQYKELKTKYEQALARLPDKQRTVFLMSRLEELKYYEIAERLNISVKAVEKRMKNALDFLKRELKT